MFSLEVIALSQALLKFFGHSFIEVTAENADSVLFMDTTLPGIVHCTLAFKELSFHLATKMIYSNSMCLVTCRLSEDLYFESSTIYSMMLVYSMLDACMQYVQ